MRTKLLLLASSAALFAAPAHAAINVGDTLQLEYLFPDTSSNINTDTFAYTGGTQTFSAFFGYFNVTVNSSSVTYSFNPSYSNSFWTPAQQNGPRLTNLTTGNAFSGWSLQSNTMNGPVSSVFAANSITTNWAGNNLAGTVVYAGGAGGVPEPSAWALLILGFGAAGAAMRRSRAKAAKVAIAF